MARRAGPRRPVGAAHARSSFRDVRQSAARTLAAGKAIVRRLGLDERAARRRVPGRGGVRRDLRRPAARIDRPAHDRPRLPGDRVARRRARRRGWRRTTRWRSASRSTWARWPSSCRWSTPPTRRRRSCRPAAIRRAGSRSIGPTRAIYSIGLDLDDLARVAAIAMIETAEGLANVEAIARTPGLDGLYIGPGDLAIALGLPVVPEQRTADERRAHEEAIERIRRGLRARRDRGRDVRGLRGRGAPPRGARASGWSPWPGTPACSRTAAAPSWRRRAAPEASPSPRRTAADCTGSVPRHSSPLSTERARQTTESDGSGRSARVANRAGLGHAEACPG